MLATLHGPISGMEMCMIWRTDHDAIDFVFELVEHFAEILKAFRSWKLFKGFASALFIDINERDNVLALTPPRLAPPRPPMPMTARFSLLFGESAACVGVDPSQ